MPVEEALVLAVVLAEDAVGEDHFGAGFPDREMRGRRQQIRIRAGFGKNRTLKHGIVISNA